MDNYAWVKIGVACVLLLVVLGLIVHRSREQKRSKLRIEQLRKNADGYHKDLAEQEERLLREAQRRQAERPGLGGIQSGYTGSLASKLERNTPPPPPMRSPGGNGSQKAGSPLTRDVRTQRAGNVPSSSSVRDTHYHEPDNTLPYLVAAAVILSDNNDNNCRESYSPPASDYNDRSTSCDSPSPSDNGPTDSGSYD